MLSVIFQIVNLIKTSPENPTTAAIGDGANDVSMIQEAHVGLGRDMPNLFNDCLEGRMIPFVYNRSTRVKFKVKKENLYSTGIMGKEGRQAVRSSDYAFGRFRFLKRALLVHGHYFYIRLATLVQYSFFKNVAFITAQAYFAFFSAYSAQVNPLRKHMYREK